MYITDKVLSCAENGFVVETARCWTPSLPTETTVSGVPSTLQSYSSIGCPELKHVFSSYTEA